MALSGTLSGGLGVFSSPLAISGTADITSLTGTLAGAITGSSADVLELGSSVPRDNSVVGSIVVDTLSGVGILDVENDSVVLAGRSIGSVTVLAAGEDTISAVSANTTIFHSGEDLTVINGSGAATVIGEVGRSLSYAVEGNAYGGLDVQGGSGRVTVFGEDDGGAIFGGTAGGNVIVAGSQPVTIAGGGTGDLLVATGDLNNVIAAAGGNETLTGAGGPATTLSSPAPTPTRSSPARATTPSSAAAARRRSSAARARPTSSPAPAPRSSSAAWARPTSRPAPDRRRCSPAAAPTSSASSTGNPAAG